MRIQTFDIGTWLYTDSQITNENNTISLDSARNGDACFQILTDLEVDKDTTCNWFIEGETEGIEVILYELSPVQVKYNSGAKYHHAKDYEEVKDIVTRKAPYEIYDLTREISNGKLWGGKVAFLVEVRVNANVDCGEKSIQIRLNVGEDKVIVNVDMRVHKYVLSDPKESPYSMQHWIIPICFGRMHAGAERGSERYYEFMEKHLKTMIRMRNNLLQLPTPEPIKDQDGKVVGFDFTENDRIAEIAVRAGFKYICSGFIAKWKEWTDTEYSLVWDVDTKVESVEGHRQLQLYFEEAHKFITRHQLEESYMYSLVDEPQIHNSLAYKALCGTVRQAFPGVPIIDPIETPNIYGGCDVGVIKQATYAKHKETYDELINMGEKFWVYACGFPAGKWMNHVLDLPPAATRLIIWQGIRYNMHGYLHYGYMDCNKGLNTMYDTNFCRNRNGESNYFPPGNHAVVYGDENDVYESVRAHIQRISAAEGEMLVRLKEKDVDTCNAIIDSVCTDFENYTSESSLVEHARRQLLEALDNLC